MNREGFPGGCNPADVLYKLAHKRGIKAPVFDLVSEQGPPHARTFTWSGSFYDGKYRTVASGRSKKEARNAVAKALCELIDLNDLPPCRVVGGGGEKRKISEGESGGENGAGTGISPAAKKKKKKNKGGNRMNEMMMMMGAGHMGMMNPMVANRMMMFGMMGGGMPMPMMPMMRQMQPKQQQQRLNVDDWYVIDRHKEIFPKQEELSVLLNMAERTETAVKRVADKFVKKDEAGKETKEIIGVSRISELAKGLLLTGDKSVSLVIMCNSKPTVSTLETVTNGVIEEFKVMAEERAKKAAEIKAKKANGQKIKTENGEEIKTEDKDAMEDEDEEDAVDEAQNPEAPYEVHMFPQEAGFCVVKVGEKDEEEMLPFAVNVTLTSTLLRKPAKDKKEDDAKKDGDESTTEIKKEEETPDEDPVDMLPRDKCLVALAELRRGKWFNAMAAPLNSCVESIRIFRDLSRRQTEWSSIGNWAIELLVERAISTAISTANSSSGLSPSRAILRCFEVVASGLLMPDGPGIKDPCEREDVDIFAHLSTQERETITHAAQEAVRKIHFRKTYQILGMPKKEFKKRGRNSGKNEEEQVEVKQEEA